MPRSLTPLLIVKLWDICGQLSVKEGLKSSTLTLASGGLEISGALVPGTLGITVSGLTVLVLLDYTGSL